MKSNSENPKKNPERPEHGRGDEIPEKHQSEQEGSGYAHQREQEQHQGGADTSYSEHVDVTAPEPREFPSVGNAKTDFVTRNQGRTTGRMLGHEPGTEGI
jgi:hypothetical protein